VNPSFSMERFQELRGGKAAPYRPAREDPADKKSPLRPEPEREILKIIRQAVEDAESVETLRREASREVAGLLEKTLEPTEAEPAGRREYSFLEIEKTADPEEAALSPGTGISLHNNNMREISDFFQRDSRRYDPGFDRY
jgi:hypothetical protein